jgi:serine/threonine-protein kinase
MKRALPWSLFAVTAAVAALALWSPWRQQVDLPPPVVKASVTLPQGHALEDRWSALALSPGGDRLVFSVRQGGTQRLFWRQIRSYELNEIPGTEGAIAPFFSPDGESVGFSVRAEHELKRVSLLGGSPQSICNCDAMDASWGADGTIVFAGYPRANLFRTSITGDEPEPVTRMDTNFEHDEIYHLFPQILPGGTHVLFTATYAGQGRIVVVSLETGERKTLIERGTFGRYLPTGHLVYVLPAEGDLLVVPFDLEKLELQGAPVSLLSGVGTHMFGGGAFALSETGALAYVPGSPGHLSRPVWVGVDGNVEPLPFSTGIYQSPRVAPDGERLSVTLMNEGDVSMWLLDPSRGTSRRLTPEATDEFWQIWHPDGTGIVANSLSRNAEAWKAGLYLYPANSSVPETLFYGGTPQPSGWTPDGRTLLFQDSFSESPTGLDILALQLDGDGTPTPIVATALNEAHPVLSPDGRWLAYISDDSGRYEVIVRSYAEGEDLVQVSSTGGFEPLWSPDGSQLYYRRQGEGGTVMAVPIRGGVALEVGRPRVLFELAHPDGSERFGSGSVYGRNYDLAPDGERFLMLETEPKPPITQVNLVLNWAEELRQRVPTYR